MEPVRILGRSSSHYTRMALIFAHELRVPFELAPIYDITSVDSATFADNPALKLPSMRRGGSTLFGSENICRALAELSDGKRRVVWPEELHSDVSRNAQELVATGMAIQVQLIFGTVINKLPADNTYFTKAKLGLEGAVRWLDAHLATALAALPAERDLSLFEVTLFCLIEHIAFRATLPLEPTPALVAFQRRFAERPSAKATVYRFDQPPGAAAGGTR